MLRHFNALYIVTNTTILGQGAMAPRRSGKSARQKPRGLIHPGMAEVMAGQLNNIETQFWVYLEHW